MKKYLAFALGIPLALSGCEEKPDTIGNSVTAEPSPAPSAPAIPSNTLARVVGQDELPSEAGVGTLANGKISSTGKAGYLIFGPYASLDAGTYQVTLNGAIESLPEGSHIVVDVVSGQGANTLGSTEISAVPATGAPLAEFTASLPSNVSDIEVRVHVPENAHASVSGYHLEQKQ